MDTSEQRALVLEDGPAQAGLEGTISAVGGDLLRGIREVLDSLPASGAGPQALARSLGVDKVLTSRVLKATRAGDAMTAARLMPGPNPLRRLVRAAGKRGAAPERVSAALEAIDRYERLIRDQVGDRSVLDAVLSAWVPEARREFELRRKQAIFKAVAQLRGVQAEQIVATVFLSPSTDGRTIDIVWLNGLMGVHRVRPGVMVRLATRRLSGGPGARKPTTLDGREINGNAPLLSAFCSRPTPQLDVRRVGEAVFYTLGDTGFGAGAAADLVFAECNRSELPRFVPVASGRKAYFFAEVNTPSESLHFDLFVHEELYPGQDPALRIYDTAFEGVASPNDPTRDMDKLDLAESIDSLGVGTWRFRSAEVSRYGELIDHVLAVTGFDGSRMRGYRCRIDYPLLGSQVTMVFDGVEAEAP
jgi:hypothetical protein